MNKFLSRTVNDLARKLMSSRLGRTGSTAPIRKSSLLREAFLEELEPRWVCSAAHPDFLIFHNGNVLPSFADPDGATGSPSGDSPSTITTAYGVNLVKFGTVVGNGAGQTIAIVDAYNEPDLASDVAAFDNYYSLPAISLTQVNETGGTTLPASDAKGGWGLETALDVEWAHVIAPDAKIVLVEATSQNDSDLYAAVDEARNYSGVSVVSMSWGEDEASSDSSNDSHFVTPSGHNGVTFVAATGDDGAYSDTGSGTKIVGYPADSVNVVGVGGTTLTTGSGGAYSSESGWGNGTSSYADGGSGGGISKYFSQPSYQKGAVTQSTTYRTIPDVSIDADPNSGVPVYDTYDNGSSTPWQQIGGTSLATPMWAGIIAIADQGRVNAGLTTLDGPTQTLPDLYKLPSTDFHDVTSGNNGYAAGTGYDLVTGIGSPIVNLLVNGLVGTTGAGTPTIGTFAASPTSVVSGTSTTLTASNVVESGGTGTISGVTFYRESNGTSGLQIGSDTTVGAGTVSGTTWTISASTAGLAAGSYTFYAVASDSNGKSSTVASTTLTVTSGSTGTPTIGSFAANPASVTVGIATTLTASSVTETGGSGSITGVNFYRESNGTSGLQIGSDTLLGAGNASGTTWTISASTSSLAAGTYTYYAVAADSNGKSSTVASATLTVTSSGSNTISGPILSWDMDGQSSFGTQDLLASPVATGATNSTGLTRGSGVNTSGTGANNAWGGDNWASTSSAGISGGESVTFGFTIGAGYSTSLSAISMNYRHSSTGPSNGYWQYQVNGGAWTLIGDYSNEFSSTSSSGAAMTPISLGGISALQSLASGSVVNFRVTPYGATSSAGTWYIYDGGNNTADLVVSASSPAHARPALTGSTSAIRVVTYNIEDDIDGNTTPLPGLYQVLEGIGEEEVQGNARPIDILGLEETTSNADVQPIVTNLNSYYNGAAVYAESSYQATQDGSNTDGNGPNALVYNTSTLNLLASVGVVTPEGETNGVYRQPVRYEFQPVGDTGTTGIFYVYVLHTKSGSTSGDATDRGEEATIVRNDEATLPANSSVIYMGDLNSNPPEAEFTNFEAAGQGEAYDPTNFSTSVQYYSESDTDLRYRDDYELMTSNVLNDTGNLNYVTGSFHNFANNGTTPSGGSVNSGSDTALNSDLVTDGGTFISASTIYSDLTTASDHLPVVADYTIAAAKTGTPTIGSFSDNPTSVTAGTSTTLTASSVTETGGSGTITGVNFYRESNGTSGLQIGSDTLVGAGSASGSTYSLSASTTGLAAGTYTFYAVATDSNGKSSSVASTTLTVTSSGSTPIHGTVLAWDTDGQGSFGTQGLNSTTTASGVTNSTGLTRGSGVSTSGTGASNAWGGDNWNSTSAGGISGGQYVTFGFTVAAGYTTSLSSISMNYRRSSSGPADGYWQYQINGGAWVEIGDFTNEFSSTSSSGAAITPISLTGISALQNLAAGTVVNFRVIPYGATSSAGTFYIYDGGDNTNDLVITAS